MLTGGVLAGLLAFDLVSASGVVEDLQDSPSQTPPVGLAGGEETGVDTMTGGGEIGLEATGLEVAGI